jgi:hypothetical protein
MTQNDFLLRYNKFKTPDESVARAEALKANAEGIDAVIVDCGEQGWTLMLRRAVLVCVATGIVVPIGEKSWLECDSFRAV